MVFPLPVIILSAIAGITVNSAQSQTPLDGPLPTPTSTTYLTDQKTAQTTMAKDVVDNSSLNTADIDQIVQSELSGALPANKREKERGAKAKELAAQMLKNMSDTPVVDEVDSDLVPKRFTQYQKAWNTRKETDGVYIARACNDCIHAVQPRELMVTSIQLPLIEKIVGYDLGDSQSFSAQMRNDYTLAVKPLIHSVDTNLNIYTASGGVHGFYLRSLPHNSNLIPDLVVKIEDNGLLPGKHGVKTMFDVQKVIEENAPKKLQVSEVLDNLRGGDETDADFVRSIEFDPAELKGFDEYLVYGSADRNLKPKVIFRDDQFTYIQWDHWDNTRLPAAFAVRDGIDKLVNTRVRGRTFIIESTASLISLKIGNSYLCLQWKGEA